MGVLDGKAAIVTGSARGIGRATAELLAQQGARVLINDLDEAGDRPRNSAEDARFAVRHPLSEQPAEGRRSRTEVGGDEGAGGETRGAERAAGVESKPADPQEARPDKAEDHTVRLHGNRR